MKKIVFVICSNGLGHFRRCIRVAYTLAQSIEKLQLTICCTAKHLKITSDWDILKALLQNPNIEIIKTGKNVQWFSDIERYDENHLFTWYKDLPTSKIKQADLVISDNLSQVLEIRPDTILMGSFIWAEVLINYFPNHQLIKKFHDYEIQLLERYRPFMIHFNEMGMDYVSKYTNARGVAWMVEKQFSLKSKSTIKNILVSGGATGSIFKTIQKIVTQLKETSDYQIFVPKRLIEHFPNCLPFDFTDKEFIDIDLMICRPGIGALTDAVTFGLPILALGELSNSEMRFNANKVEALNFGRNAMLKTDEITSLIREIDQSNQFQVFQEALQNAPKGGLEEAVIFIKAQLN